ncbi:uncharacterized protein LOC134176776 [Corticium candelabrum]|uniref:uncharacterized protein LOC134176776 n=1 Tax=Corticium candelabrum TaxID=121492 RepID=UPI002E26A4EF|nr:uncharacterized protein LOC134176776 [Corticium candelabrum]
MSLPPETKEDTIFGFDKKLYDWLIIAGIGVLSLIIIIIIICVCYRCICRAQDKTDGSDVQLKDRRRLDDGTHFYGSEGSGLAEQYDDVTDTNGFVGPSMTSFRPKQKPNEYESGGAGYEAVGGAPLTKAMKKAIDQKGGSGYTNLPNTEDESYPVSDGRKSSVGKRSGSIKQPESNLVLDNPGSEPTQAYAAIDMSKKKRHQQSSEPTDAYAVVDMGRKTSRMRHDEVNNSYEPVERGRKSSRHQSHGRQQYDDPQQSGIPMTRGSMKAQRSGEIQYTDVDFTGNDPAAAGYRRPPGDPIDYSSVMIPQQKVIEAEL